jgi:hypothetical protein
MESINSWQNHIQMAQRFAWKRLVTPTIEECYSFLECCYGDNSSNNNKTTKENRNKIDNNEMINTAPLKGSDDANTNATQIWWKQFCLPLSMTNIANTGSSCRTSPQQQQQQQQECLTIQYPPETLPIVIISSPFNNSCVLDRQFISTTIWNPVTLFIFQSSSLMISTTIAMGGVRSLTALIQCGEDGSTGRLGRMCHCPHQLQ